jgi:hypothetical protein
MNRTLQQNAICQNTNCLTAGVHLSFLSRVRNLTFLLSCSIPIAFFSLIFAGNFRPSWYSLKTNRECGVLNWNLLRAARRENNVAASTPQVFTGITPAQYIKLTEKAKAAGVAINGNNGRASRMGVEVMWNYSEEKQELVLTCLKTPFFVKAQDINAKLHALVNEVLTA